MMRLIRYLAVGLVVLAASVQAATVSFNSDPFAGTDALTTPGRQLVGGEPSITFNIASDVFRFNREIFGVDEVLFGNGLVGDLPETGVNVVIVRNTGDPFLAGTAANLIADRFTESGPGFFVYFNTGLQLARLVYSTDLSDAEADLAVLARMTNIAGAEGFAALGDFTEGNFAPIPEPATILLTGAGVLATLAWRRRRTQS